jgi:hypothetical protein
MLIERMRAILIKFELEIFLLCLTPVLIFDNGHGPLKKSNSAQAAKNLVGVYWPQN